MLKTWTLAHFKSVYDPTPLELAPLTIFAGANSSGKSTLIQSLLFTAQTLQSRVPTRSAVLNGHILRLGAFDDILSHACDSRVITIGFALDVADVPDRGLDPSSYYYGRPLPPGASIRCDFALSAGTCDRRDDTLQLQPQLESSSLTVSAPDDEQVLRTTSVRLVRSGTSIEARSTELELSAARDYKAFLPALEYEVQEPSTAQMLPRYLRQSLGGWPVGAAMDHFLPASLAVRYDATEEEAVSLVERLAPTTHRSWPRSQDFAIPDGLRDAFISVLDGVVMRLPQGAQQQAASFVAQLKESFTWAALQEFYRQTPGVMDRLIDQALVENRDTFLAAARDGRNTEYSLSYAPLPESCEAGRQFIRRYFTQYLRYLGPLRDEPKPIYPLAGAAETRDIGLAGENTAAVLDLHKNTLIDYVPSRAFDPNASVEVTRTSLIAAALDWLDYMGIATDVVTHDRGKFGHELKIAPVGSRLQSDLTHVGVGVSQVLPILVLCLLAARGSTLILEQPELHLHPRVQTRLADFFLSLTYVGKQCLVETHSEYLINRLRLRAVLAPKRTVADAVCVYFVETDGGRSRYRPVRIDEYGVIGDWPRGFFDESESIAEAILRAAMQKRAEDQEDG